MKLPIGLQLYTLRNELKADFAGTLRKVSEMGYVGVEFAGLYGNDPKVVRDLLQSLSLVPISAHVPLAEMLEDSEKVFADYRTIGCRYLVVPYLPEDWRIGARDPKETFAAIRRVAKGAKAYGLTMLYHNHDFEFVRMPDGEDYFLDRLYAELPADILQTEIDTCWVGVAGENPAAYVKKYSGRAPIVHLKDYYKAGAGTEGLYELIGIQAAATATESTFELRPVGHGVQDVPAILAAAETAGAEWLIVEQDRPSAGQMPLDECKKSRAYLRSLGY